jgi:iron(III) transport system substrate-binding protein
MPLNTPTREVPSRSHAPRGNAFLDAPRPFGRRGASRTAFPRGTVGTSDATPRRATFTLLALLLLGLLGCGAEGRKVVVYSSQDPEFAAPLLDGYAKQTGIEVETKFDVESSKTVGLAQLLIRESPKPRCDLFWNNEILNTLRLHEKGLLATWSPGNAADIPSEFKAKDGTWYGFAARARILIVNTKLMPESDRPKGLADLIDPRWKGKIAIAKPLFGTTATHATCLFAAWGDEKAKAFFSALKQNEVQVVSGNKQVATAVGSGQALFGLTDTDDAIGEVDAGQPVAIIYPDRGEHELGTLFIPNVLSIPKGAPHPVEGEALGNHLLGPEAEGKLASGPSAQIPLNVKTVVPSRVETPKTVHAMPADFEAAARIWDRVAAYLASEFAGG